MHIEVKIMEQTKKQSIIAGIIALVVSLGIGVTPEVFDNELQDYYHCDKTGDISEFKGGVSGTGYSGYPFAESRKGAVRCGTTEDKGNWVKLSIIAEEFGIDAYDLILEQEEKEIKENPAHSSKKEICHPGTDACVPV